MRVPVKRLTSGVLGASDIDPEIKDLVLALNRRGYRTINSCAGDAYATAEISFKKFKPPLIKDEKEDIREIVKSHTDVPFHWLGNSIIFKRPLGGLPEQTGKEGDPGWFMEFAEHIEDEEELKRLREEAVKKGFWE